MKFSFNKSKPKSKPPTINAFQPSLKPKPINKPINNNEQSQETKMNVEEQKIDNSKINTNDLDPCTIFKQQYTIAIQSASNNNFIESLRAFDISIRFWGVYLEQLKTQYPYHYKQFKFPDINSCDASKYFLNLYKKNKDKLRKKTKKKLWKPPPKHQPKIPIKNENKLDNDNDVEIIYFNDSNSDDVDLIEDINETEMKINENKIKEWEKNLLFHRKIGSEMYEYHAQVLMEMDRDFEAIKAAQSAILLNEMNDINWLTLSRAELNFGDPFQSLLSISRGIELNFENDEIIEHYSYVYGICNKLNEMKENGKMSDDVLKRRLVMRKCCDKEMCENDVKLVKKRLEKRGNLNDHIGRMDNKTERDIIVENYQNIIKMTKKLNIDSEKI